MQTITQSRISREYVGITVGAKKQGKFYDPSGDVVQLAFMTPATPDNPPAPSDAQDAAWDMAGSQTSAVCLVGPGGTIDLDVGTYGIWVHIGDNPEDVWRLVGTLVIV